MAALNAARLRRAIDDLTNISNWKRLILRFFKSAFRAWSVRTNVPLLCHKSQRRLNLTEHYQHYLLNLSNIQWSGVRSVCLWQTCKQCLTRHRLTQTQHSKALLWTDICNCVFQIIICIVHKLWPLAIRERSMSNIAYKSGLRWWKEIQHFKGPMTSQF